MNEDFFGKPLLLLIALIVLGVLFLPSCGGMKTTDFVQETPGGNVFVPHILDQENLITCKTVAYCVYKDNEWEECRPRLEAKKVHLEKMCLDLGRDDDPFPIPMDVWKADHAQDFGEYRNEDIFKILENRKYVMEHTPLYKDKIPDMVEKFKQFHQ